MISQQYFSVKRRRPCATKFYDPLAGATGFSCTVSEDASGQPPGTRRETKPKTLNTILETSKCVTANTNIAPLFASKPKAIHTVIYVKWPRLGMARKANYRMPP